MSAEAASYYTLMSPTELPKEELPPHPFPLAYSRFNKFFTMSAIAYRSFFYGNIYQLFDEDTKVHSFARLFRLLREGKHVPDGVIESWERRLTTVAPVADKIKRIRSTLLAHRNAGMTYNDMKSRWNAKIGELEQVLSVSDEVINSVAKENRSTAVLLKFLGNFPSPFEGFLGGRERFSCPAPFTTAICLIPFDAFDDDHANPWK